MKITIITLFPDMIQGFFNESIIKRAQEKKLVEIEIVNLREFALDSYGSVDDRPFGGGAGMLFRVEPIAAALQKVKKNSQEKIILPSAQGKLFTQQKALEFAKLDHLIIVVPHYEGVDARVLDLIDEEVSMGDFVLTGGEIPTCAIVDSVVRLLPGVLRKEDATVEESFFCVNIDELLDIFPDEENLKSLQKKDVKQIQLLEYPQYTRPQEYNGKKVPEELLTGDPKKIRKWQLKEAYKNTLEKRPDLLTIIRCK